MKEGNNEPNCCEEHIESVQRHSVKRCVMCGLLGSTDGRTPYKQAVTEAETERAT